MKWICFLFAIFYSCENIEAQQAPHFKWSEYMKKQELHWDSISANYYTGILLGNGRLGTNIYKENDSSIRFDIGRSDVTDQRPHYPDSIFAEQLVSRARLPIGKMLLEMHGKIISVQMKLDLYNAEASGIIQTTKGEIQFTAIVPTGEEVVMLTVAGSAGEINTHWKWIPEKSISPRISFGSVNPKRFNYVNNPPEELKDSAGYSICYQPLLHYGSYATVWKETKNQNKAFVTIAVGYQLVNQKSPVKEAITYLQKCGSKKISEIERVHRQWWNTYFQKSFISIPDARMEGYYWMQLYNLASATRKGKPMVDLMGPWFTSKTPWPAIWWNLNTQLAYSPIFTSNHLEIGRSLFDALNSNVQNLINNVPVEWRNDAAAIGRISSYDLVSPLITGDIRNGRFEPGDLTWTLYYYYQYFLYSRDTAELKKHIYPLLKRSVNYLVHLLYKDEKGTYHLPSSQSPEYANTVDAHYSLSSLRWGLQTVLRIDSLLALNDITRKKWEEVYKNLVPYYVNETGYMMGKDLALTSSHRHFSHLLMIYPFREVSITEPSSLEIINRSINHWQSLDKALAGYSYVGASSMSSLLGKGNEAYHYLNTFLNHHGEANGLYRESGPCFESPMATVTSMLEMLLQSKGEVIKVFPAIPDAWKEVSFENLRTVGAFLISAMKENNQISFISIKSLKGGQIQIESDIMMEALMISSNIDKGKKYELIRNGPKTILKLTMKKNEKLILKNKPQPKFRESSPVFKDLFYNNFWGLQKRKLIFKNSD